MKTRELSDCVLDYAVALAEGYKPVEHTILASTWVEKKNARGVMTPCPVSSLHFTDGKPGDDIIDREFIDTEYFRSDEVWYASVFLSDECVQMAGATRREAAMRAYVASKLGEEVDIPKELL